MVSSKIKISLPFIPKVGKTYHISDGETDLFVLITDLHKQRAPTQWTHMTVICGSSSNANIDIYKGQYWHNYILAGFWLEDII